MASSESLTLDTVVKYIQENGCKVSNHELVRHFKSFLNDGPNKEIARLLFKDIVNTVSSVQKDGDEKYLILKSQFMPGKWPLTSPRRDDADTLPQPDLHQYDMVHSYSSPSILETLQDSPTPQPPPRRKGTSKQRGTKIEEKLQQLSQEKDAMLPPKSAGEEITVSPVSVKERAQKLNKMATSESDLTSLANPALKKGQLKASTDDEDAASLSGLDPRTKTWMTKAAQADYTALLVLLKEEPRLASYKTALHWAAKFGKGEIVKLIAGTHRVSSNIPSGYTALHVAYMFNQLEIVELLTKTYGADSSIRDYSGKLPHQYLPSEMKAAENGRRTGSRQHKAQHQHHHHHVWSSEFIRIGSLNSKVRKTAAAITGGRSIGRIKSWGSADSLSDQLSMPPPKFAMKKKRSKKVESSSEKLNKLPTSDYESVC